MAPISTSLRLCLIASKSATPVSMPAMGPTPVGSSNARMRATSSGLDGSKDIVICAVFETSTPAVTSAPATTPYFSLPTVTPVSSLAPAV